MKEVRRIKILEVNPPRYNNIGVIREDRCEMKL